MIRRLVVGLLAFAAGEAAAQGKLSGTVRDSAGAPISGAVLSVTGTSRHQATTDRRGAYSVTGIKAGTITVSVRRLGYAPYEGALTVYDGENRLDAVLIAQPQSLDTMATREQQLWREYPALREFEENRKLGLGQFVTRAELAKMQGGFVSQVFNQMRGLVVVRGARTATWLASKYMPNVGVCTTLEDGGEGITPPGANCNYCFPEVYLDNARISANLYAPNIARFSPDQLQAIEVYQGPAEAPAKYSSTKTGCGIVVFHSRAVEIKARRIASIYDQPTRSRVFASISASAATVGSTCNDCGIGSAVDAMAGYTFADRWVLGARFAKWNSSQGGAQTVNLRQAFLEWYPRPEPGRLKWFVNAGGGLMSVNLNTSHHGLLPSGRDSVAGSGLANVFAGTGMDVQVVRRLVMTPFVSYTRSIAGRASNLHCTMTPTATGTTETCGLIPPHARTFSLLQAGTRVGWR
jgi:hypothetical protein